MWKLIVFSILLSTCLISDANGFMDWLFGKSDNPPANLTASNLTESKGNQAGWHVNVTNNLNNREFNSTERFINETMSHMPRGICTKEVPTASLILHGGKVPAGNGSNSMMSRIQVCCGGFERDPLIFRKCNPVCRDGCMNGICVAPDICECLPKHVLNLGGFCIPTCPVSCENGICMNDGTCKCNAGYQLEPRFGKYCVPHCDGGCENGNCTAPNHCVCKSGYEMDYSGNCKPVCVGGCATGECIAPGVCSCREGYVNRNSGCEAICTKPCANGRCIQPDVCSCDYGWELDVSGSRCNPKCSRPCLNGHCTAPDRCGCNRGYVVDENDPFTCVAHCPSGCPNGVCTAPNMCLCKSGFVKDRSVKGSQACIPAH